MTLIEILLRCLELTLASEDSDWSHLRVTEIAAILEQNIKILESGLSLNCEKLKLMFAPTGPLQETAMANNWSSEYLQLAETFDALID